MKRYCRIIGALFLPLVIGLSGCGGTSTATSEDITLPVPSTSSETTSNLPQPTTPEPLVASVAQYARFITKAAPAVSQNVVTLNNCGANGLIREYPAKCRAQIPKARAQIERFAASLKALHTLGSATYVGAPSAEINTLVRGTEEVAALAQVTAKNAMKGCAESGCNSRSWIAMMAGANTLMDKMEEWQKHGATVPQVSGGTR